MVGFLDVVVTAFVLQLLALPGEKGQLVIGSLSTRYRPGVVVAGAATAFGAWTAVEIAVGTALKGALPAIHLDAATAVLFFAFGVMLFRTTPDVGAVTDGGYTFDGVTSSSAFDGFLSSFSLMMVGEFGDKTQLVTLGLAAQYGAHPGIWVGEMLAIVPMSLATALVFHRVTDLVSTRLIHRLAGALFLAFGLDIVASHLLGFSVLPF